MRMGWMAWALVIGCLGTPLSAGAEEMPLNPLPILQLPHTTQPAATPPPPALLDQLAGAYTTPNAVAAFLHEAFTFQRDEELFGEADHWQSPEAFVARKGGDCEDYALLARELLRRNGIEAYVFSVFGEEDYAHTVCVFVDQRGRYHVIDGDTLHQLRATSLEAVASRLDPAWTSWAIAERVGARGQIIRQVTNLHHPASFQALTDPLTAVSF